jgi:hypothetical protein
MAMKRACAVKEEKVACISCLTCVSNNLDFDASLPIGTTHPRSPRLSSSRLLTGALTHEPTRCNLHKQILE